MPLSFISVYVSLSLIPLPFESVKLSPGSFQLLLFISTKASERSHCPSGKSVKGSSKPIKYVSLRKLLTIRDIGERFPTFEDCLVSISVFKNIKISMSDNSFWKRLL